MAETESKFFKFIGCEIIFREACYLAAVCPHRIDLEFLRKGLHDLETSDMLSRVQSTLDDVGPDGRYDAVLLGYARCNDGLVGLEARDVPLVIPRAHDCITMFFGSRQGYQRYFDEHPGTYFMTTGWTERGNPEAVDDAGMLKQAGAPQGGVMAKLGLNESYEEMVSKYGKENADFIAATVGNWRENYSRLLYLKMGVCDEAPFIARADEMARKHQWELEVRDGNMGLLRKLFNGDWDDDFLIVPPGGKLAASNDERILRVEE